MDSLICDYCSDDTSQTPTIMQLLWYGKVYSFCDEDCCKDFLLEQVDAMEVDNPDYEE